MNARLPLLMLVVTLCAATAADAQRFATQQAFTRLEESLRPAVEEGTLGPSGIGPSIFVGARPAFEDSRGWFPGAALETVSRVLGRENLRACEACMNPRLYVREGRMVHNSVLSLPEIVRIDAEVRGDAPPARSAVWVDETPAGIAVRIVSLENGRVLYAGNFDGDQREKARVSKNYNASLEMDRRLRGESLTHVFIDAALFPGQHISVDFAEQFGPNNEDLAGVTVSVLDPVLGIGVVYYRVIPVAFNAMVGGQVVVSLPTALISAFTGEVTDVIDPILTGLLVARVPIPETNYAVVLSASTNGVVGIGVTFMNFSLLPVLP